MSERIPNFLIIGAQKSGTTSLADALNRHSQVFVCEPMEPEFFSRVAIDKSQEKSLSKYRHLFEHAPVGAVCGEASTGTMLSSDVIPHIEKYAPEVKLIALLRAPEKRAYSAYTHDCKKGRVVLDVQDSIFRQEAECYINKKENRFDWFSRSEYAKQLKSFADYYGERFKIIIFEELIEEEVKGLNEIQEFLGLRQEQLSLTRENRSRIPKNKETEKMISLGRKLVGPLRNLLSERSYRHFREALMSKLGKLPPQLDKDLANRLRKECFQQDIHELEKILGRKIEAWK